MKSKGRAEIRIEKQREQSCGWRMSNHLSIMVREGCKVFAGVVGETRVR